ncbi:MAG: XRE family transcriptional regulator [Streptococcaceae bacterium]|jgi:hypothetical protein|nr:XRE family transcriptional regulator [Streptococcaceae bacterium]
MFVDTEKIEWLLENRSQYFIAKTSGIAQSKLSGLKNKKILVENLTISSGAKLTALAIQEQQTTQD